MDYTVCVILQDGILEGVAFPFSRGSTFSNLGLNLQKCKEDPLLFSIPWLFWLKLKTYIPYDQFI